MYQINDVIVYENAGVCKIKDIGVPDFIKNNETYYTLQPICDNGGTIYVKTDNVKMLMRSVITKAKAEEYLAKLPEMKALYNENDKVREREYRDVIKSCEVKQCLQMVKGISLERNRRVKDGKKLNMTDDRNLKKAGRLLSAEFAIAFDITIEQANDKIIDSIELI